MTAGTAFAQPAAREPGWPLRPIRLIAPFPPASTSDVIARILGQKLSARLGQQLVIDNRVGASGNIGADAIAKAAPDGYTLGMVTVSTQAVAVSLVPNLPYDPVKDFTPIAMVASSPYALVVYAGLPAKSVADLELSVRSRKALQRLNINTVGELASRTEAELLGCKNFGQTSLNEIKQQLSGFGMSLRKLED